MGEASICQVKGAGMQDLGIKGIQFGNQLAISLFLVDIFTSANLTRRRSRTLSRPASRTRRKWDLPPS
jgi:hypothetical protein